MAKRSNLVSYATACRTLTTRLRASSAEIAVWLVVEQSSHRTDPAHGRLNTFTGEGVWFKWNPAMHESHNLALLVGLFLDAHELATFDPAQGYGRWFPYAVLVERWARFGFPQEWIEELIASLARDARERAEIRFAHESVRFDRATLIAFDPHTMWASDPKQGMFQEWQVEEVERALGLVRTVPDSIVAAAQTLLDPVREAESRRVFAQLGAAAKHRETEGFRREFLAAWDRGQFKGNKSAAARWGRKQYPIDSDETFKRWIRAHEK